MGQTKYEIIVVGASAGGIEATKKFLAPLPTDFPLPIVIIQHMDQEADNVFLAQLLMESCPLKVKEVSEKESIRPGIVYITPPNYHLLIEEDKTFSLSVDPKVNWARPSIDVLFESAADVYGDTLIGIIMTGASSDGGNGLKKIKEHGGLTIVQDPKEAYSDFMPKTAIERTQVDYILHIKDISQLIINLSNNKQTGTPK